MAGSPGNLISLAGESPPTNPSSYEDAGARLHQGWGIPHRQIMTPSPTSLSPPTGSRRPLSYHMDTNYLSQTPPQSSAASQRRSSMHSPLHAAEQTRSPFLQPAYPDSKVDATSASLAGLRAGDKGLYFGFDKLPTSSGSAEAETVVVAGYHGGLRIYSVGKRGLDPAGSLKGLRGGVLNAKILPWTLQHDAEGLFPLICIVLHGPVVPAAASAQVPDDGASVKTDAPPNGAALPVVDAYQTTVEIYSLKTNQLVDIVLQGPLQPISTQVSITSPLFQPPPPSSSFSIHCGDGLIGICSGSSGECWIYSQLSEKQNGHYIACLGKMWTCLQRNYRPDNSDETNAIQNKSTSRPNGQLPAFSMSGHWIAYAPAAPSSQMSLRAHIPVPILGKGPGVTSVTPPQAPQLNSSIETSMADSMVNKIMRETTQELLQGAKWVGKQGLQAWNSYWNKPAGQHHPATQSPPNQWNGTHGAATTVGTSAAAASNFPPTHGASTPSAVKEPGLISIVDAHSLPLSSSLHPLITFPSPGGCSFLSLSPTSFNLFTASSKGDVQIVWDLLRLRNTHLSPLQTATSTSSASGPLVRQVAQFSRMTVARIIDVCWKQPAGDRLAVVTERGTVHMLDMPFAASLWPPPRRRRVRAKSDDNKADAPAASAVSMATGAIGAAYQAAKPFVSRSRRSSAGNGTVGGAPVAPVTTLKESAAHSGRAIAASITSSIGKTGTAINQLRHTRENRVALPSSASLPSPCCVAWSAAKRSSLYAVGGGTIRKFPERGRTISSATRNRPARSTRHTDFKVPLLPDDTVPPLIRKVLDGMPAEDYLDLSEPETDVANTVTLKGKRATAMADPGSAAAITHVEIETSTPYQPFHTDRRVGLCEYSTTATLLGDTDQSKGDTAPKTGKKSKNTSGSAVVAAVAAQKPAGSSQPWAFGGNLPCTTIKVSVMSLGAEEDEMDGVMEEDGGPLMSSTTQHITQYGEAEQIVVTTRRRRGVRQGDGGLEDGFFEDDCEVLDFADRRV